MVQSVSSVPVKAPHFSDLLLCNLKHLHPRWCLRLGYSGLLFIMQRSLCLQAIHLTSAVDLDNTPCSARSFHLKVRACSFHLVPLHIEMFGRHVNVVRFDGCFPSLVQDANVPFCVSVYVVFGSTCGACVVICMCLHETMRADV